MLQKIISLMKLQQKQQMLLHIDKCYVQVYKDFSYEIKYIDKVKWVYDPSHPSACVSGEKKGFVAYPDIDIQQQKEDILKIRDLHDIDV